MYDFIEELKKIGVDEETIDTVEQLADRRIRLLSFGGKVCFFNTRGDYVKMFDDMSEDRAKLVSAYSMHLTCKYYDPQ